MELRWISLEGFRSYLEVRWEPAPGINVLVGGNGAGKTNLLEAVGYLAALRSFRRTPEAALIGEDAEAAVIRGEVGADDSTSLIEIEIPRQGVRRALLNRQRLGRVADLLGHVRTVAFLPDDLDLVKRGPALRRELLDELSVQLWPSSYLDQAEYDRALKQRNRFLKTSADDAVTLSVWDERLSQSGGKVMARRARAAAELLPRVGRAYHSIADDEAEIDITYFSDWGGELDPTVPAQEYARRLLEALSGRHRHDRERGMTTLGPHRDDPMILLDGHDLRHHGSQGEQRTVVLGIRLASHRTLTEAVDRSPILLLDDVYSELDPDRGEALTRALPPAQTFVTTADPGSVPLEGKVWHVADGKVMW